MIQIKQGSVQIKDPDKLLSWYTGVSYQEAKKMSEKIKECLDERFPFAKESQSAMYRQFNMNGLVSAFESRWPEHHKQSVSQLKTFLDFYKQGLEVKCGLWVEGQLAYIYIGNPKTGFVFGNPEKWFEFHDAPDFSEISPAQLKAQKALGTQEGLSGMDIVSSAQMTFTQKNIKSELVDKEEQIANLSDEIKRVNSSQTKELADLQAKIEEMKQQLWKKKEMMLAELNKRMEEMEEQKEKLENQIYLLDSQIFAIRCYAGETVKFISLRTGKEAPVDEPVVVHQKLRFLDEELGKLASLYSIQWEELGMFEEFLKHSPLAMDTFAPNTRCIVLVRLSKTGKELGYSTVPGYENMLEQYNYFHGKAVGIIIRNGENLYLGWTDENYVKIDDDLVNNVVNLNGEVEPEHFTFESDKKAFQRRQKEHRKKVMSDILSRVFVSNILQGIVDNSKLLNLPDGTRFDQDSPYIKYAIADAWLDDGRFGSFEKIIEQCNKNVCTGDMVLTVQHLVPEHDRTWGSNSWNALDRPWENPRGRGEANRTHDCNVDDCTLYPVNLVEYDDVVKMVRYRFPMPSSTKEKPRWQYGTMSEENWKRLDAVGTREFVEAFEKRNRHVFVSVKKETNWRRNEPYERAPRANFELYDNEYINLTYMNSVWLGWAITQKKLGDWKIGGKTVDYAYGIRYLKTAMEYIRVREKDEKSLLDALDTDVCKDSEWPLRLSEWKMKKGVRALTPYQAKRFVKTHRASK